MTHDFINMAKEKQRKPKENTSCLVTCACGCLWPPRPRAGLAGVGRGGKASATTTGTAGAAGAAGAVEAAKAGVGTMGAVTAGAGAAAAAASASFCGRGVKPHKIRQLTITHRK